MKEKNSMMELIVWARRQFPRPPSFSTPFYWKKNKLIVKNKTVKLVSSKVITKHLYLSLNMGNASFCRKLSRYIYKICTPRNKEMNVTHAQFGLNVYISVFFLLYGVMVTTNLTCTQISPQDDQPATT